MDYKKQRKKVFIPPYDCRVPCNLTTKQKEILTKLTLLENKTMGSILQEAFQKYIDEYKL